MPRNYLVTGHFFINGSDVNSHGDRENQLFSIPATIDRQVHLKNPKKTYLYQNFSNGLYNETTATSVVSTFAY
ncbi:MAG: hypothetical protein KA340_08020, partial [Saprospiraceae bacterium]|nr:hypothetical protein [Saprospiraceae bacterium]